MADKATQKPSTLAYINKCITATADKATQKPSTLAYINKCDTAPADKATQNPSTLTYINKGDTATVDKADCYSLSYKVDTRQLSKSSSKTLLLIDMNTIQQLALENSIPLHVNSPAIAHYPWQTAILKATNLDNIFKDTNLKVQSSKFIYNTL